MYVADEVRHDVSCDAAAIRRVERLHAVEKRTLGTINGTMREMYFVTELRLTFAGKHGVLLRAAQDHAGRDVEDPSRGVRRVTVGRELVECWRLQECLGILAPLQGAIEASEGGGHPPKLGWPSPSATNCQPFRLKISLRSLC